MDVQELKHLIRIYSGLKRDARTALIGFIRADGSVPRRHGGDLATRTTLRSAEYFRRDEEGSPGSGAKEPKLLELDAKASKLLGEVGATFGTMDAFTIVRHLALAPAEISRYQDPVNRSQDVCKALFLEASLSTPLRGELRHTLYIHGFNSVVSQAHEARVDPTILAPLDASMKYLRQACEAEVYKQIAHAQGSSLHAFDIGQLAFGIEPALGLLTPGIAQVALDVAVSAYRNGFNLSVAPYLVKEQNDRYIRPHQFEVLTAIVRACRLATRRSERLLACSVAFTDVIRNAAFELRSSMHTGNPAGWGYYGDSHPEGWPTLAALEFISEALHLLRTFTLLQLEDSYGFDLQLNVPKADDKLDQRVRAPFDLHRNLLKFCHSGSNTLTSAVLFGPPGTGKTSIVRSIAARLGWDFAVITPADLAQDGPNQIVARARDLLGALADVERTVVLLDEFDLFILSRDGQAPSGTEPTFSALVTNCMLPLLAALGESTRARFFLATNYADRLDDAATRIGRFSAILPVWPLSKAERQEVIKGELKLDPSGIDDLVGKSRWATFGELKALCNMDSNQRDLELDRLRSTWDGTKEDKWREQLGLARPAIGGPRTLD